MRHKPRGPVGTKLLSGLWISTPEIAPESRRADALLRRTHQVNREQPLVQRDVTVLKMVPTVTVNC